MNWFFFFWPHGGTRIARLAPLAQKFQIWPPSERGITEGWHVSLSALGGHGNLVARDTSAPPDRGRLSAHFPQIGWLLSAAKDCWKWHSVKCFACIKCQCLLRLECIKCLTLLLASHAWNAVDAKFAALSALQYCGRWPVALATRFPHLSSAESDTCRPAVIPRSKRGPNLKFLNQRS